MIVEKTNTKRVIIWDFDGTLLPLQPYDSEQALLRYKLDHTKLTLCKRLITHLIIYADMHEWFRYRFLRSRFKQFYQWSLKGTTVQTLEDVTDQLATTICRADRHTLLKLKETHDMFVLSCGTADLSLRILEYAGLGQCFKAIIGNRFKIRHNRITGVSFYVRMPQDKLTHVKRQRICAEKAIVVGDGYTDIPLLDWAAVPILIDRTGKKKARYDNKNYYFASTISHVAEIINKISG